MAADEDCDIQIPVANFKSNHIAKKQVGLDERLSPTAQIGKRTILLDPSVVITKDGPVGKVNYCVCGNFRRNDQDSCDTCSGKNSLHLEGEIFKKQKKGGNLKRYWYVLMGKQLYSYKNQGDAKHKEMKSLAGVYLKEEVDEANESGQMLFPFMLIFPNKRRIYYFKTAEEKA